MLNKGMHFCTHVITLPWSEPYCWGIIGEGESFPIVLSRVICALVIDLACGWCW